jgi:hypothetical protein
MKIKENKMINFTGSEKQITWAQQILEDANKKMFAELETANERVKNKSMPVYWASCVLDAINLLKDALHKDLGDTSAKWIDNRKNVDSLAGRVNELASKKYKKLYEIYGMSAITVDQYNAA